jgi:hypothetical protein
MSPAAVVLACALTALGRSESSMPHIEFLKTPPPRVSPRAEAFVHNETRTIYLIMSSEVFRDAVDAGRDCWKGTAFRKIASILVHEEWHILHGADERDAYHAQLITLWSLGLGPDSRVYRDVLKSMVRVLNEQRLRKPELVIAKQ